MILQHKFVEFIPETIKQGVLYVSIEYSTAVHKCVCGCGNEVVTPLSPTDWEIMFNGKNVTLYPSIGNWSVKCKSHYWISKGKVKYARNWDESEIEFCREKDALSKREFYSKLHRDFNS